MTESRPKIRAYVVGPQGTELDVFYTLPNSLGLEWDFEHLLLERDTFTLELLGDVHRSHRIRNAIVVVASRELDRYTRIGIAHAWREGVRRFILLLAGRSAPSVKETHELEQELRVLLDSLGDGGAAPCIRAALTRCAGRTEGMRPAMLRLLEEIERVFTPLDEDVVDAPLPESFAAETAILDAVTPLIRSATMIEKNFIPFNETAELRDGTGGTHEDGWPYLAIDEPWPQCTRCNIDNECLLQIDMCDAIHDPPPAHRLFVVYRCRRCYGDAIVRHYPYSPAANRQPLRHSVEEARVFVVERRGHMLPEGELVESDFPEVVEKLRAIDADWGRLYWWTETAMGMSSLRIPDHLGGWQCSQYPTQSRCARCNAIQILVSSTQCGDGWYSLWACADHPDETHFNFHK